MTGPPSTIRGEGGGDRRGNPQKAEGESDIARSGQNCPGKPGKTGNYREINRARNGRETGTREGPIKH